MSADGMLSGLVGAFGSITVGAILMLLRQLAAHRAETARQTTCIAVIETKLISVEHRLERLAGTIDATSAKLDTLSCAACSPPIQRKVG